MAPKTGPSLRDLMKNRNKAPSPQDKNKSKPPVNPPPPPPPQLPADLRLKPNPDLRRKRHTEVGMAMGRSGAEGWDLRPRPAWIFLAPSPPLKAPRRPAKPRPIS